MYLASMGVASTYVILGDTFMSRSFPISIVDEIEFGSEVTRIQIHVLAVLISDIVAEPRDTPLFPRSKLTTPAVDILI